ncbi:MAG: selenocysteine-specific translation elongation factor [Armatimonadota bacterium]|nr:selenocysteine-specific translation elongation factor [Armatimonadota bacterium]
MAYLIGTAGHVDHGKTTLIAALTGIDADRLPEEKARGMTIDLGFAFVELEGIGRVSIVDVPGHERFIKNMLAGASGVDVALLCIAADEGVMPQTKEHFQILRLLEARSLVAAITKVDMVDADTTSLAELDAASLLTGTPYERAEVVRVSAQKGEGIDDLKEALRKAITDLGPRPASSTWFMPIDRVFTIEGHGTVVTGTLASGQVKEFDDGMLMPGSHKARIRGVQTHGEAPGTAEAGMRTALNVTGVRKDILHRGQAIGSPGSLFETDCLNVRLAAVEDVKHGSRVRVHIGTGEFIGKIFLFDHAPGFAQLRLEEPTACARGQRAVIRQYSPPNILAGAEVVTPNAKHRRKNDPEVADLLSGQVESKGDLDARIMAHLDKLPAGAPTAKICEALGESPQTLGEAFERLKDTGEAFGFAGHWLAKRHYEDIAVRLGETLAGLHAQRPQAAVVPKSEVLAESGLKWGPKPFDRLLARLVDDGHISARGSYLARPDHQITLNEKQAALLERVVKAMTDAGASVPAPRDLAIVVGAPPQAIEEMIRLGVETGRLIRVDDNIFYPVEALDALRAKVREFGKPFTVAQFRDVTNSSRKFALPILQYFDETRFTRRVGDERIVIG